MMGTKLKERSTLDMIWHILIPALSTLFSLQGARASQTASRGDKWWNHENSNNVMRQLMEYPLVRAEGASEMQSTGWAALDRTGQGHGVRLILCHSPSRGIHWRQRSSCWNQEVYERTHFCKMNSVCWRQATLRNSSHTEWQGKVRVALDSRPVTQRTRVVTKHPWFKFSPSIWKASLWNVLNTVTHAQVTVRHVATHQASSDQLPQF